MKFAIYAKVNGDWIFQWGGFVSKDEAAEFAKCSIFRGDCKIVAQP